MKGQGKIKYWFTKNGVHVPVYEKYTTRKGVEPENVKAKFNTSKKSPSSIKDIPKTEDLEIKTAPWGNGTNSSEDVQKKIDEEIERAKSEGYEIVPRPYQTRGRSGKHYDWTEIGISYPTKSSSSEPFKPTKGSNLGKHLESTRAEYEDVIALPYKPILPIITKGRQGWKTKYGAEYVVMARKKRKK